MNGLVLTEKGNRVYMKLWVIYKPDVKFKYELFVIESKPHGEDFINNGRFKPSLDHKKDKILFNRTLKELLKNRTYVHSLSSMADFFDVKFYDERKGRWDITSLNLFYKNYCNCEDYIIFKAFIYRRTEKAQRIYIDNLIKNISVNY